MGLGEGSELPYDVGVIGQGEMEGRARGAAQALASSRVWDAAVRTGPRPPGHPVSGGTVRYVLMICSDETAGTDPEQAAATGCGGWSREMERRGVIRGGAGLAPSDRATTVKVRGDEVLLTDGPFAETKDQIGGFTVIECGGLREAVEIAARHPWAALGQIEIRPVEEPGPATA
ncbi:YciI family protein [Actinomadura luteofluorescens]|uniref:YciI family protein n=1 Tax=Actinomadura luteofluorescens TaxID=46163 RepID=UPI00363880B9